MASLENISTEESMKKVEEERSVKIDSVIVRIMKARKTLEHQDLISNVLSQIVLFRADARLVKKRIENLIEREYLKRDDENPNLYTYLA